MVGRFLVFAALCLEASLAIHVGNGNDEANVELTTNPKPKKMDRKPKEPSRSSGVGGGNPAGAAADVLPDADKESVGGVEVPTDAAIGETNPQLGGRGSGKPAAGDKMGLVVIDVQKCFTEEGEGLANPRGDAAYKKSVNDLVSSMHQMGVPIVILQDYHPANHISFGNNVYGKDWTWKPGPMPGKDQFVPEDTNYCQEAFDFDNRKMASNKTEFLPTFNDESGNELSKCTPSSQPYVSQPLFPVHCVQGTDEVQFIDGLCEAAGGTTMKDTCVSSSNMTKILHKGTNPGIDSFGGIFDNRVIHGANVSDPKTHWGVFQFFEQHKVNHLVHIGIADDYCVLSTAALPEVRDLRKRFGITKSSVVPELTYGIVSQLQDRKGAKKDENLVQKYVEGQVSMMTVRELTKGKATGATRSGSSPTPPAESGTAAADE